MLLTCSIIFIFHCGGRMILHGVRGTIASTSYRSFSKLQRVGWLYSCTVYIQYKTLTDTHPARTRAKREGVEKLLSL